MFEKKALSLSKNSTDLGNDIKNLSKNSKDLSQNTKRN